MKTWIRNNNEWLLWTLALAGLFAGGAPAPGSTGFCPFQWLALEHCIGCGLGRSISAALHGNWMLSWQFHPMGLPAILIIVHRIITLIIKTNKPKNDAQLPVHVP